MLDATTTLKVATGIAQIHARHPHTTGAAQKTLHEASGGRFLLGLGVSHRPFIEGSRKLDYSTPYSDMVEYLAAIGEGAVHRRRRRHTAGDGACRPRAQDAAAGRHRRRRRPSRTSPPSSTPRTPARSSATARCWRPSRWW